MLSNIGRRCFKDRLMALSLLKRFLYFLFFLASYLLVLSAIEF